MVKLHAPLLALTLTTSLSLAIPLNYYDQDLPMLERDLDYLEAREPSFFGGIGKAFKDVGKVAKKGFNVAEKVAQNPIVQVAASAIPGEGELVAAGKIAGALGKVKKFEKAAKVVKKADKHLGGAKKVVNRAKQVHKVVSRVHQVTPAHNSGRNNNAQRGRHHRRDLEDDEELLRRDLDAEEVFERQYDDFLDERDFFDDLD